MVLRTSPRQCPGYAQTLVIRSLGTAILDYAERLAALRARLQRSLADPRPSLTEARVIERLKELLESDREEGM